MDTLNLRKARVLVTGGAGLIGSHLVDHLLQERVAEVVVLDNFVRGRRENLAGAAGAVTIVDGDIRDRALVGEVIKGIDVVFHQAAIGVTQSAEDPALAMDVLVNGTFNVLEAAVKAGVRKVVAASSASVYGLADKFPTDEHHHPYNDRTVYGSAKAFNEGLLRSFNEMYGLEYIALRYFDVYGPRMDPSGGDTAVFIRWMEQIAAGQPPVICGDGHQTMDLINVEDIARANILAARAPVTDAVFNVATGTEVSMNECAELLLAAMDSPLAVQFQPARTVNPVPRRSASTWRAQQELGFQAVVPFEQGLRRLAEWWRMQQSIAVLA
ncbi:MAG: NAD-dependent epimerase/dehydratase family protein [Acidobacteriota bacterium]